MKVKSQSPVFFLSDCRRSYMLNDSLKCKDVPYISVQFIFWVYFESYSQNIKYFCSNSRVLKQRQQSTIIKSKGLYDNFCNFITELTDLIKLSMYANIIKTLTFIMQIVTLQVILSRIRSLFSQKKGFSYISFFV